MAQIEKTVFISCRRTKISWALAIIQYLTDHGYDVFFNDASSDGGDSQQVILENIKARAHFLVVFAPSALKGYENSDDWQRFEIEIAVDNKRNIIPMMLEGFDFEAPESLKYLTGKLGRLKNITGVNLHVDYFEEGLQRLCHQFLDLPLETGLTPLSERVQSIVLAQKKALASEARVEARVLAAQEWFEKGYLSKDLEEKVRFYSRAIELDPQDAFSFKNRGSCYNNLGQYQLAIKDLDQALELDPKVVAAYNNRGFSYDALGQYKRAIEDYDRAIALDPKNSRIYINRGANFYNLGQYTQAIEDFDRAIKLDPKDAFAYHNRGLSFHHLGQYKRAIENYNRTIELNPKFVYAYHNRGKSYHALGQPEQAIEDFDRAIELDPNCSDAYDNRGVSHQYLGQYARAFEDFDQAIMNDQEGASPYYNKACCYAVQGNVKKALQWLQEALKRDAHKYCELARQDTNFDKVKDLEDFQNLLNRFC